LVKDTGPGVGFGKLKNATLEEAKMCDERGEPLACAPNLELLLDLLGIFEDYVIPEDATLNDIARVFSDSHTQQAVFELFKRLKPVIDKAIYFDDFPGPGSLRCHGLVVDCTPDQCFRDAHEEEGIPFY